MDYGIDKETDSFAAYIDCLPQTSRVFSNQGGDGRCLGLHYVKQAPQHSYLGQAWLAGSRARGSTPEQDLASYHDCLS